LTISKIIAKPFRNKAPSRQAAQAKSIQSDELKAENQRLRKALAEKLHAENAEFRKRLGL
jgi:hypothetical protein